MFGLFASKGPFNVQLDDGTTSFKVNAGDNLLKAALAAGLAWPHNCRVGSCGTCRCRLVEGKIKPLSDFSYVLDETELDAGMILSCQTSLRSDVRVRVQLDGHEAYAPATTSGGNIDRMVGLTHDIVELGIQLDQPLPPYRAGQYAELSVPGIERPRSYSFARAPHVEAPGHATFHVRRVPGGEMTEWLHAKDRTGTHVSLTGPHGSFHQRKAKGRMLCVAGGSGMAPIKALLECAAGRGFDRDVLYLFGARTRKDLYCTTEMALIAERSGGRFRFVPVLSHEPPDSGWDGARGMVTQQLRQISQTDVPADAYLCGPPPMIDAAITELKQLGLDPSRIYFDKFLDASHLPGGKRKP